MSKTLDDKQKFIELRAKGYSFAKIASETGVSKPTLISWSQDDDVMRDVHNLKTLHIDELQEQYVMSKQHRISVFGDLLNRAKAELAERDLSDVPTDKLVAMVVKLSDTLRQDESELELHGDIDLPRIELGELKTWKI